MTPRTPLTKSGTNSSVRCLSTVAHLTQASTSVSGQQHKYTSWIRKASSTRCAKKQRRKDNSSSNPTWSWLASRRLTTTSLSNSKRKVSSIRTMHATTSSRTCSTKSHSASPSLPVVRVLRVTQQPSEPSSLQRGLRLSRLQIRSICLALMKESSGKKSKS